MRKGRLSLISGTRIGRYLILLAALCWFTIPASAADAAHSAVAMHLLRPGTAAVADLDGDHIPDVASGIRTGRTSEGYSYQVDLDFSANPGAKPLSVFSEDASGLNIEAIDIDGDQDLDLVITGRFSARPISVWLNDGRGGFTQGDLSKYVVPVWETRPSVHSPVMGPAVVLHFERRRSEIAGSRERVDSRTADSYFGEAYLAAVNLPHISIGSARLRAPPIQSV